MPKKLIKKKSDSGSEVKTANKKDKKKSSYTMSIILCVIIIIALSVFLYFKLTEVKIELEDKILVDYTGYLENGSVFDTSIESVGVAAGLEKPEYKPLNFKVGREQVIKGFEENVIGLRVGDKKKFVVSPEDGYGETKDNLIIRGLKRQVDLLRYSVVSLNSYKSVFEGDPVVGVNLTRPDIPWTLKVVEINNGSVKIENLLNIGDIIPVYGSEWNATVLGINETNIHLFQHMKLNDRIVLPMPQGMISGVVAAVNETDYDLDTNNPLAGKNLTFEVEIKEIIKP